MQIAIRKTLFNRRGQDIGQEIIDTLALREKGEARFYLGQNLYLPESSLNRDILQMDGTTIHWELATQEDVNNFLKL